MKVRSGYLLIFLAALALWCAGRQPAQAADPRLTTTSGRVTGVDNAEGILGVNTRMGPRSFLITNQTLILLNNHAAPNNGIQIGDQVEVDFRFDTAEAYVVQIIREQRRAGRVVSVGDDTVGFRVRQGAQIALEWDGLSRFRVQGIALEDPSVLVGLKANAIIEPDSLLVLNFDADAAEFSGRVQAVDTVNSTVTIAGKKVRTFDFAENGTIRRGGFGDLEDLAVGDRVKVAFRKAGSSSEALAIQVRD